MTEIEQLRFCYADPPYLGCGKKIYNDMHEKAEEWDRPERHRQLIEQLCDEFPDGWAMSLHSPSLRTILPMCPENCRVAAWVKPFAVFKANVTVAYAWEPVIFRGGRKRPRTMPTVRDWVSENITLKKGCPGAKPEKFTLWLLDMLNVHPHDEFVDMFPGSGMVTKAFEQWKRSSQAALKIKEQTNERD